AARRQGTGFLHRGEWIRYRACLERGSSHVAAMDPPCLGCNLELRVIAHVDPPRGVPIRASGLNQSRAEPNYVEFRKGLSLNNDFGEYVEADVVCPRDLPLRSLERRK